VILKKAVDVESPERERGRRERSPTPHPRGGPRGEEGAESSGGQDADDWSVSAISEQEPADGDGGKAETRPRKVTWDPAVKIWGQGKKKGQGKGKGKEKDEARGSPPGGKEKEQASGEGGGRRRVGRMEEIRSELPGGRGQPFILWALAAAGDAVPPREPGKPCAAQCRTSNGR
jgi:hypothetical protein